MVAIVTIYELLTRTFLTNEPNFCKSRKAGHPFFWFFFFLLKGRTPRKHNKAKTLRFQNNTSSNCCTRGHGRGHLVSKHCAFLSFDKYQKTIAKASNCHLLSKHVHFSFKKYHMTISKASNYKCPLVSNL